VLEEGVTKFF